ncbi:MAG TPA: DUF2911 domain-containing protein [Bryobacteraceae bacterium]|jgi:DUF2911 family protein|nr:DUF2911 domain-containing protein [Bryobacteraceae bacterium]
MKKLSHSLAGLSLLAFAVAGLLTGQETKQVHPGKGGSPHVTTTYKMDGKTVSITYGRPLKKNREIFGKTIAHGQVWRLGADEATTLETTADLMIGPLHVVAGKYTLYAVPGPKEWTLVISKQTGQWGTVYNKDQDYGRTAMKLTKASSPVEQLTITIEGKGDDKMLKVAWDDAVATVPLMVH